MKTFTIALALMALLSSCKRERAGLIAPDYKGANQLMAYGRHGDHYYFCTVDPSKVSSSSATATLASVTPTEATRKAEAALNLAIPDFTGYSHRATSKIDIGGGYVFGVYFARNVIETNYRTLSPGQEVQMALYVYPDGTVELPVKAKP